jgi:hypothetical protein
MKNSNLDEEKCLPDEHQLSGSEQFAAWQDRRLRSN